MERGILMPRKKKPIRIFEIRINLVFGIFGGVGLVLSIVCITLAPSSKLIQPLVVYSIILITGGLFADLARRKRYKPSDVPPSIKRCVIYLTLLLAGAVFLLTTPFWVYNGLSYIFAIIPLIFLALSLSGVLVLEIHRQRQLNSIEIA